MTAKQTAFLQALLTESTVTQAIKTANISRSTAYKYLNDVDFQKELNKHRQEALTSTVRFLQGKLSVCAEKLVEIVENPNTKDQVKINAINSIYANCKAITETAEVVERLQTIEELLEQEGD